MPYLLYALYALAAIIVVLILVVLIRALSLKSDRKKIEKLDKDFSPDTDRYVKSLSDMVKIKTISSKEDTYSKEVIQFFDYIKQRYPNVCKHAEWFDINGGMFFKLKGKDSVKPMVLMSHLDVVPALGNWQHDAFGGEVIDNVIWGRGTVDTKGSLCAILEALESLLQGEYKFNRDVYVLSTSREEIAGDDCPNAVALFKKWGIAPEYVFDEGGAILEKPLAGTIGKFGMMAISEHGSAKIILKAHKGGSKLPMEKLARLVLKTKKYKFSKPEMSEEVLAMFKGFAPNMTFGMKIIFANVWLFKGLLLKLLPKISNEAKSMIGVTHYFSSTSDEVNSQLVMGDCAMQLSIVVTAHVDMDEIVKKYCEFAKKNGIEAEILNLRRTPKAEPLNSTGNIIAAETINAIFKNVVPTPYILMGGTDSRHFVGYAKNVVRFAPLFFTYKQFLGMHGIDECLNTSSLADGVSYYRELILRLN